MQTYDDIAEWYDAWLGSDSMRDDPYFPAVEALMGNVAGRRICDLACGQGRLTRHLADQGARVVGVDFSARLLEIARRHEHEHPCGIEYLHADARRLDPAALGLFDSVVCYMALMDIPDLAPTLRGVADILRPGGWFVFAILHPCFHTARSDEMETPEGTVRTIGRYFDEGHWRSDTRTGPPGKVGAYHRTLATYVNSLLDAGLQLTRLVETSGAADSPPSPSNTGAARPVWAEVPAVLAAACVKPAS
ncbi:MAG TPA: class I SAM-dependent methyltransferase [Ktedonobacterales bacterium]|nr:class I SAM-dependent methyltransferase [Ktedonobacterales bacterium]